MSLASMYPRGTLLWLRTKSGAPHSICFGSLVTFVPGSYRVEERLQGRPVGVFSRVALCVRAG